MKARLEPLDGLRGIAMALVVWFHLWQVTWLPATVAPFWPRARLGRHSGDRFSSWVDLFYFTSGFCLYYPYARATFGGRTAPTTGEFAYRRALKILPSYVLFPLLAWAARQHARRSGHYQPFRRGSGAWLTRCCLSVADLI